jgi:hypothetical protein
MYSKRVVVGRPFCIFAFYCFYKMLKYLTLTSLLLMVAHGLVAQTGQRKQLLDASTGMPVAFANVVFDRQGKGTMSDINGFFNVDVDAVGDSVFIRCLGYHPQAIGKKEFAALISILMSPSNYELSPVDVYPGVNPALAIMVQVVRNIPVNNPDLTADYQCNIYHKMVFRYLVNDSLRYPGSISPRLAASMDDHYLLLMESLSEKRHKAPGTSSEQVISSRVSGFNDASLAMLPVQIQPFVFYQKYVKLMDDDYLNPVSDQGIDHYFFHIEDTVTNALGDTLYYISFVPKRRSNINGLKGSLHVHAQTWAIKSVSATAEKTGGSLWLTIRQNYRQVNGVQWFPEQLESSLVIIPKRFSPQMPYPIVAEGKSYVTSVNLNPTFTAKDFSMFALTDKSQSTNAPSIDTYRYVPLSAKDSATYLKIDSIGRQKNLDNLLALQRNLLDGYIPIGVMKLDYRKLFDYTSFEGLKLGIGLWTSEKVSEVWSTGGYFVHGFASHQNNYGVGAKLIVSKRLESSLNVNWRDEFAEVGVYSFVDGFKLRSPESFRKFLSETMDRRRELLFSAESRIAKGLKGRINALYNESEPVANYSFFVDNTVVAPAYTGAEVSLNLRYQPRESLAFSSMGVYSEGSPWPVMWLNLAYGQGDEAVAFDYSKIEMQVEHPLILSPAQSLVLRLVGGGIWGDCPPSLLYSAFGTYKSLGVDIPHAFSTMRMNEFAANRFATASLVYNYAFNLNSGTKFKPVLELSSKAGWADFRPSGMLNGYNVFSFSEGYYESGASVKRLLGSQFVQYGVGCHYRYGPYSFTNWQQNLAMVVCVELTL